MPEVYEDVLAKIEAEELISQRLRDALFAASREGRDVVWCEACKTPDRKASSGVLRHRC